MKRVLKPFVLSVAGLLVASFAYAALQFPALTGRVVDEANLISPQTKATLEQQLAEYENGTTNQVVVVTLSSLQNTTIEDFGYKLGRTWGIGQKGKDNGVLLIVAPNEHKTRIEVGRRLEPVLTDAISSQIVNGIMVPDFKAGKMEQGIVDGTEAILSVLGGKGLALPVRQEQPSLLGTIVFIMFLLLFFSFSRRHPFLASMMLLNNSSRFGGSRYSGGSGFGGGGGFSGGGGSFGGGGASGGW